MDIYSSLILKFYALLIHITSGNLRIKVLRMMGLRIGKDCLINAKDFSTEPYLIKIGNHVAIASGTHFITHDGSVWIMREENPEIDIFGEIKIGDNTFIGAHSIILPGTIIGSNCVIGAGSVIRGIIDDDSVVAGNPGKIMFKTSVLKMMLSGNKNKLLTKKFGLQAKRNILLKHFQIET
jgi:acetyltransferase-like isoleucine patch superfamily enzyme